MKKQKKLKSIQEEGMEYVHGGDIYTYKGMLDFSVNVNPLGPSERVIDAAKRGAERAMEYPDSRCGRLKEALAEKKGIPAERVIAGNGAADLFFSLVLAERPRTAVIPVPAFSEYEQALKTVGCEVREYFLKKESNLGIKVNSFFKKSIIMQTIKKQRNIARGMLKIFW